VILDWRFGKIFRIGQVRLQGLVGFFNLVNGNVAFGVSDPFRGSRRRPSPAARSGSAPRRSSGWPLRSSRPSAGRILRRRLPPGAEASLGDTVYLNIVTLDAGYVTFLVSELGALP
jgi:hypothetical protein